LKSGISMARNDAQVCEHPELRDPVKFLEHFGVVRGE
jgi:hypothetical protein